MSWLIYQKQKFNLNTSNVKVNPYIQLSLLGIPADLNTSNVKVNPKYRENGVDVWTI